MNTFPSLGIALPPSLGALSALIRYECHRRVCQNGDNDDDNDGDDDDDDDAAL